MQQQGQERQEENNNDNNSNHVTLDLRVSCNTFWKYEMKLNINRDNFVEPNENDIVNGGCGGGAAASCFNSHVFKTRKTFVRHDDCTHSRRFGTERTRRTH